MLLSVISSVRLRPKLYVPYWILVSLFVAQTVAVCFTHCLTARLALCDTLFLVIALSSKGFECTENASGVLRSAALIAFEGLIFANFTHAAQMLVERHDEGVHLKGIYIGLTVVDVLIKLVLMCARIMPRIHIGFLSHILLHFSSTVATLLVAVLDYFMHDEGIILKADPAFTLVTSAMLAIIALPAFFRTMPPIFGDIPSNFRLDEFKAEINAKFCSAYCQHIHVYRRWPMDSFDAFLSVVYRCSTAEPNWEQKAQANVVRIQNEIRSVLMKAGARRVTVEPLITQETPSTHWTQCINDRCRMKSCC
uniref:RGS domain-containing protein n=1 Tax=Ascaris lumbricoides TaxID=6252 RepID=A0A0M3HYQ9_ASCLU